jgi:SAM-dependent methyltransferase
MATSGERTGPKNGMVEANGEAWKLVAKAFTEIAPRGSPVRVRLAPLGKGLQMQAFRFQQRERNRPKSGRGQVLVKLGVFGGLSGDVRVARPYSVVVADTFLDRLLDEAESRPVQGWDFSWLGDRVAKTPLPWSFERIVQRHALQSQDMLDMGTGGGEWLAALAHHPARTVATEAWPPNIDIAGARLRPVGITVVRVEAARDNVEQEPDEEQGRLPFPAGSFSLVSNRHESFLASEVARILAPNGSFLTQQVGGAYDDFYDALGMPRPSRARRWDMGFASHQLQAAGLRVVDGAGGIEETSFADVGAFAWYLKAIPWVVEGFSIATHRPHLQRLHERVVTARPIRVRQPAFWVKAVKDS